MIDRFEDRLPTWPDTRLGLDVGLLIAAVSILTWGLVMVASASVAAGESASGSPLQFFWKQLAFVLLGGGVGTVMWCVPMAFWARTTWIMFGGAVAVLVIVLIPGLGVEVNHATRWLNTPFVRLQPSEPARIALFIYLAGYLVRRQAEVQTSFSGLAKPLAILLIPAVLLLAEPDFGATVVLYAVAFLMIFMSGAPLAYFAGLLLVAVAGLAFIATTESYRMARLLNFTNPWADVEAGGWQLSQSLIAIGRGEWWGVGLGNSIQKLLYLPEMHTDFIFAILAEEFGLLGVAILIALYAVLVSRGFGIARTAELREARFSAYLCYGLVGWLGLQALINFAVNMGMAPTKGLTLPLMSYGGSSLITAMAALGLILRVDYENRLAEKAGENRR
jgi:cell division protein FtsW